MPPIAFPSSPMRSRSTSSRGPKARPLSLTQTDSHRSEKARPGGALGRYVDRTGRARELLSVPGHGGSVLVLDRDAATLCDRRLVAHLGPDEPHENALMISRLYVEDIRGRWCRRVRPEDLEVDPFEVEKGDSLDGGDRADRNVVDKQGNLYCLQPVSSERPGAHLRWLRRSSSAPEDAWEQVSLREVISALESYEPMRTITVRAIASHGDDPTVSVTRLRNEFDRLCSSPVVLNRGLREAVLDAVQRHGTSMSEIALRCGVVKHDRRGNVSGETSWLARRIGVMPEGGERAITPWVHSDVLAVIARSGLGISPREVELQ